MANNQSAKRVGQTFSLPALLPRADSAAECRAWYLGAILICFALLVGNWPLVTGKALPVWDAADFFGPEFSLVADHIKAGRFLLWNPWVGAGNPDFAEPELGSTSPIMLVMGLLSPNPQVGFVSYWLLIWFIGGLGMLLLARSLGAPAWGATILSLGFISSGLFTGHAEHTSSIYSSSFLPWILWRFNCALEAQRAESRAAEQMRNPLLQAVSASPSCAFASDRRRYWFAVQAGALYGLSALGGYPEFTILTPLFLALWTVGRICFAPRENGDPPRVSLRTILPACVMLLLVVSIGGLIFSPSYVGILEATRGFSDKVGPRPRVESVSSNILAAGALTTFASPYLALLNFPPNGIWPRSDISMTSIYLSPALLIFALFAWLHRSVWRWWLAGLIVVFLCCCLGDQLPVRGWIYDFVWPTRYFRNPSLFRAYVILLMSAVAALGLRDFISNDSRRQNRVLFSAASLFVIAGGFVAFAAVVHHFHKYFEGYAIGQISYYSLGVAQLLVTGLGIVTLALLFQFNFISLRLTGNLLLAIALFNAVTTLRISKPTMYSEATVPWWHAENEGHIKSVNLGEAGLARQLDAPPSVAALFNNRNVPLRVPTLRSYITLTNRFQEQFDADPALYSMALGAHRFWFSAKPIELPPTNSNFDLFRQKADASSRPPLFIHTEKEMLTISSKDAPSNSPAVATSIGDQSLGEPAVISDVTYGPNTLAFHYQAPVAGWLMVTDRWAPDWQVSLNGVPQPDMGADFIFRAIHVNQGENQIRFHYLPRFFVPLLLMSWAMLLFIAISQLPRFPFTGK